MYYTASYDTYSPLLANIKQRAMPGAAKQWLSADHWKLVKTIKH